MDEPAAYAPGASALSTAAAEGLAKLRRSWLEVAAHTLAHDDVLVRLLEEGLQSASGAAWPPTEAALLVVTENASQHAIEAGSPEAARGLSKRLRRAIYEFLLSLDAASAAEQPGRTLTMEGAGADDAGIAATAGARGGNRPELVWDEPELRVLDGGDHTAEAPPAIVPPDEFHGLAPAGVEEPMAAWPVADAAALGGSGWAAGDGGPLRDRDGERAEPPATDAEPPALAAMAAGEAVAPPDAAADAALADGPEQAADPALPVGPVAASARPALERPDDEPARLVVALDSAGDPVPTSAVVDLQRVPEIFRRDQPASPLVVPSYRAWADVLAAGGEQPAAPAPSTRWVPPTAPAAPRPATAPHKPPGGLAARLRNRTAAATAEAAGPTAPLLSTSPLAPAWGVPGAPRDATPGPLSGWPSMRGQPPAGTHITAAPPEPPVVTGAGIDLGATPARPLASEAPWPAAAAEPAPHPAAEGWSGGSEPGLDAAREVAGQARWPAGGSVGAAGWPSHLSPQPRPPAPAPAETASDPDDPSSWSVRRSPKQQVLHERMAQRRRDEAIRAATVDFDEHAGHPRRARGPELDRLRLPEQIDTLLRRKRGGEAAALMQRAAQELGGHEVAELSLACGDRCRSAGQTRAAINSYLAAWRADPLYETPLWRLAETCLADRVPELAAGYLERVADLMRARGDDEAAMGVYRKIITVAPERGDVRALLQAAQALGRFPD